MTKSTLVLAIWIALCAVVVALGFVRLLPSDPDDWHVPLTFQSESDAPLRRIIEAGPDALARLDGIARGTARTRVLAGSVAEGRITYVTRSRVLGFPDYTTVQQDGDTLRILARQRFGASDLGVNRARVARWVRLLEP